MGPRYARSEPMALTSSSWRRVQGSHSHCGSANRCRARYRSRRLNSNVAELKAMYGIREALLRTVSAARISDVVPKEMIAEGTSRQAHGGVSREAPSGYPSSSLWRCRTGWPGDVVGVMLNLTRTSLMDETGLLFSGADLTPDERIRERSPLRKLACQPYIGSWP